MRGRVVVAAAALGAVSLLSGQTQINGGRTVKGAWDASGAISTKPAKSGTVLPATCGTGEQFFKTDAAAGQNVYLCTAANTWTAASGGGGSTNVGLTMPAEFSVSGSPVNGSGTLAVSKANQNANLVYAGPASGSAAQPGFRGLAAADLPANNRLSTFGITIDGGGQPITAGLKGYLTMPYACTITNWNLQADQSGSIAVDVWKSVGAIPGAGTSITAGAPPSLTAAQLAQNGAVAGWSTAVARNDVVAFNVNGTPAAITRATLVIECQR